MNIYPSLMVVPEQDLKKEIQLLSPHCAGFHIDIMDGIFVPTTFWYDAEQVNEVVKLAQRVWIHLMVQNPQAFYHQLELPSGSMVSFHIESNVDSFAFSKIIKEKNQRVSLAIKPKTPIAEIIPFLNVVDHVLIMSVEPGQSGQSFLEDTYKKIDELVAVRNEYQMDFAIGVDGGIGAVNIQCLAQQGINDCAVATGIFGKEDHVAALRELQK
jgi:ribulose-phosphate 3-epimerase